MDTFCHSPVTDNAQGDIANVTNERRISSDILAETIKYLMDWRFNQQSMILHIKIQRKMTQKAIKTAIQR